VLGRQLLSLSKCRTDSILLPEVLSGAGCAHAYWVRYVLGNADTY
jgi:hypothetical protein